MILKDEYRCELIYQRLNGKSKCAVRDKLTADAGTPKINHLKSLCSFAREKAPAKQQKLTGTQVNNKAVYRQERGLSL